MSWAAVIAGGAALVGGYMSSQGAKKAGNAAAAGTDAAINEQRRQFDLTRNDTAPYRAIGQQALNALGSIYGYQPAANYFGTSPIPPGANAFQPGAIKDDGFFNTGAGAVLNPWTVTGKLPGAAKILDPAGAIFGNLFGNKHGDEKRNLKAFTEQNTIYDLGNGMLALADGTTFPQANLQKVAGAWYGATYAPDGNQDQWKQTYAGLVTKPQAPANAAPNGYDPSSGYMLGPNGSIQQGIPGGSGAGAVGTNPLAGPNYSAFFASPDYTFRRDEGTRGIENTFSASGGAKSGNALRALAEFNSNLAAGEFGNYFNRQAALAGIGQTATNTAVTAGQNTANNVSNALVSGADARASGIGGSYDAWGNALGTIGGIGYNYFNRPSRPQLASSGYGTPYAGRLA